MKGQRRYKIRLAAALIVAIGGLAAVLATDTRPALGLDLEGGISVILTATSAEGEVEPGVLAQTVEIIRQRIDALGVAEPEVSSAGSNNILVQLPGVEDEQRALELIGSTAQLTFRQVEQVIEPNAQDPPEVTEDASPAVNDEEVVYPDASNPDLLYSLKPAELTGDVITQAQAATDPQSGAWRVDLVMNDEGARVWEEFTSKLACLRDRGEQVKSQVAIVLDGEVESATGMASPAESGTGGVECNVGITGGESVITTGGEKESKDLALVLQTGALPLTLEQSQVSNVSPTLGRDSLQAGLTAGIVGIALVMLYVLLYYRALGLVVWLGLALFSAAIYSLIAILGATAGLSLTLAGIAGIIVSIGVTADSYIVAFERLKDEVRTGKSLRAAVDRGMERAFRTILVADFVTAAAAVILFILAVGPVKGFALTLGLATAVDVLVAYFFTRSAVNLLATSPRFTGGSFIGMKRALGVEA
jgi:preprotein translocase subunit SecD